MSRLPTPGGDDGNWGDILNSYLLVALNADGTLKPIDKSNVGLSNVDNTADADKPISDLTVTALGTKVDDTTTVNGQPLSGNVSLTTNDVTEVADKKYVTDAEKTVIGTTSGTNTGDLVFASLDTASLAEALEIPVNDAGTTKKITKANLFKKSNVITVGSSGCDYATIEAAIAAAVAAGVTFNPTAPANDNPMVIEVSAGIYTAPVGGYILNGISGLSIRGAGMEHTVLKHNAANDHSDEFIVNMDNSTNYCSMSMLQLKAGKSNTYGGCVYQDGGYENNFINVKFTWNYNYAVVGGSHEGVYFNCAFLNNRTNDTNDLCISAGDEVWTGGANVTVSNDATDKIHYDASAVFTTTGAGVANGAAIGTIVPSYIPVAGQCHSLWIKLNWACNAGALKIKLGTATGAGNTGNISTLTLPAMSANTWYKILYNSASTWSGAIAEVKLENASGSTLAAGKIVKINDYWYERTRYKTNRAYAFAGIPSYSSMIGCDFSIRQYVASPTDSQHKTLLGVCDFGSDNALYKNVTAGGTIYAGDAGVGGTAHFSGGRLHHTIKRYGHAESFSVHDGVTVTVAGIVIMAWSDPSPTPIGTEHTWRYINAKQTATIAATAPVQAYYDANLLDANNHAIDFGSTGKFTASGSWTVNNTADLPPATSCKGAIFSDKESGTIKYSNGTGWLTITAA